MADHQIAVNINDGTITDVAGLHIVPEPDESTLAAITEDSSLLADYVAEHGTSIGRFLTDADD